MDAYSAYFLESYSSTPSMKFSCVILDGQCTKLREQFRLALGRSGSTDLLVCQVNMYNYLLGMPSNCEESNCGVIIHA